MESLNERNKDVTMNEQEPTEAQKPKTSKLATVSVVFASVPFCLLLFVMSVGHLPHWIHRILESVALASFLAAPILSIVALTHIKRSKGLVSGRARAVAAIVISAIMIAQALMPATGKVSPLGERLICMTYLKALGTVIEVYANDYNDRLPTAKVWCDLLITQAEVDPKSFICRSSGAIPGESSYALNKNVVAMKLSEIPRDVVLLFETNFGRTEMSRKGFINSREFYRFFLEHEDWEIISGMEKVYKLRWNQVCGPELLTTENHEGKGCNILFADGHAAFVKKDDLDKLRWEP